MEKQLFPTLLLDGAAQYSLALEHSWLVDEDIFYLPLELQERFSFMLCKLKKITAQ